MIGGFLKHTKAPLYPDKNSKLAKLLPSKVFHVKENDPARFNTILDGMADAKVVMIGEATHGTQEYYKIRAEITKRLIKEKQFNLVSVEGDWPDVYRINRYVCGKSKDKNAQEALSDFQRFPKWMWRNVVVEEFVEWLKNYNDEIPKLEDKVRFYGLDLYSMFRSADLVIDYLNKVDKKDAEIARRRYGTLSRYREREYKYAEDVMLNITPTQEKEVVSMLVTMMSKGEEYLRGYGGYINGDELFFAQMNARLVKDAEEYYRKAYAGGAVTWNIRDKHMADTLEALLAYHTKDSGHQSKAVVWAHNSHLGDSRATEYARESGEYNIGQLVRQRFGKEHSFNVGFTSYSGTVTAAPSWGGPATKFKLTPAFEDSYEAAFHHMVPGNWLLMLRSNNPSIVPDPEIIQLLTATRTERMVGVQYVKRTERQSHYVPAILPKQFDCVIHLDTTSALEPLDKIEQSE